MLVVVKTVANDEVVWNIEAAVADVEVHLEVVWLDKERCHMQFSRMFGLQRFQ